MNSEPGTEGSLSNEDKIAEIATELEKVKGKRLKLEDIIIDHIYDNLEVIEEAYQEGWPEVRLDTFVGDNLCEILNHPAGLHEAQSRLQSLKYKLHPILERSKMYFFASGPHPRFPDRMNPHYHSGTPYMLYELVIDFHQYHMY